MKLDTIALIASIIAATIWLSVILIGTLSTPAGYPIAIIIVGFLIILFKVINDRRHNAEDDYYEKNVEK